MFFTDNIEVPLYVSLKLLSYADKNIARYTHFTSVLFNNPSLKDVYVSTLYSQFWYLIVIRYGDGGREWFRVG
ncbi:hypothetical protein HZH66_010736 [Vespula vulgaris]|uniref:Uncharacterized protein n=1 Tax=Vespula vulgaris TaxID=7454 RepID=A0A834JGM1_VESVU|nr:hypothetical protein HZH66_010736 [Vespula vulgaris]